MRQLKEADRDRYLSLFFVPEAAQGKLAALYLFDAELEKIRHQVSEPQLGQIRLQWWRESLSAAYAGQPAAHPLIGELAVLSSTVPLSVFDNMIEAAETTLFKQQLATTTELEQWLGQSSSLVIQAAMLLLGGNAAEVAGLAGVPSGWRAALQLARAGSYQPSYRTA